MNLVVVDSLATAGEQKPQSESARFEKVIVVNPPSPPGYVAVRESHGGYGQLYSPGAPIPISMDVPYLVGYLAAKVLALEVIEAQGLEMDTEQLSKAVAAAAAKHSAQQVLVVARVALCCLDWDLSVCGAIKKAVPGVAVAVYGSIIPDVLKRVEQELGLDYILQGEPDETVSELAAGHALDRIAGLMFRRGGAWVENPSRPLAHDLDKLPFPKWELLPYRKYTLPKSSSTASVPYLPMLTSRGCPFGCHYCPYPITQGLPFRFRSPLNVVDELEHLVKNLGIEYVIFRDPMFSLRQDRVVAICEEIQRRGLQVRWKCETRVDCLNEKTLLAMAAAGCEGINFGIESAEVLIQKNVGRKAISREKFLDTVALCRKIGIRTFCFFIIGLPGDTAETILESIGFAIRLQPTWVQFNAATPLIGTKLRTWAVSAGLASESELSYRTSHEAVIGNENLTTEQVAALHRFAMFFEKYLINRGGILKDESRTGWLYGAARRAADGCATIAASAIFAISRSRFQRAHAQRAAPVRALQ
jgi:hypothetical protein